MPTCLFLFLLLPLPSLASPPTHPFPGITFTEQTRTNPPLHLYWIQADLTNPAIHLRLCPGGPPPDNTWETTLLPVSKIAQRDKLDIAINGSYFTPKNYKLFFGRKLPYFTANPARASGFTITDGRLWSAHPLSLDFPSLAIFTNGSLSIARFTTPPPNAAQLLSGCKLLLHDGLPSAPDDPPAPRTAIGLDAANKTLTLLVIDGRRPTYSVGLSLKQTADELKRLGCQTALDLDGGGSSTLVIRNNEKWPVINTPSDGHDLPIPFSVERPVANALGIVVEK